MAPKAAKATRQKSEDKVLLFTIGAKGIEANFKGPWTGLDVQKVAGSVHRYYQQHQHRRLQEAREAAKSAPSQEKS